MSSYDFEKDTEGLRRARLTAQWWLGDRTWATVILAAYFGESHSAVDEALGELSPVEVEGDGGQA